jgi:hypothetical protein
MNDDGYITILDTVSDREESLGPGSEATWSPDGAFIAASNAISSAIAGTRTSDYFVVRMSTKERSPLFSSAPPPFFGPAIWFPDSRFLLIQRSRGEYIDLYVFDRIANELNKPPRGNWGLSWGGRP